MTDLRFCIGQNKVAIRPGSTVVSNEKMYQGLDRVFDPNTLLKFLKNALYIHVYIQLSSWCLEMWPNTAFHV